MFCPNCGHENPEGVQSCIQCGADLSVPAVVEAPVGEVAAGKGPGGRKLPVWAIVVGAVGILLAVIICIVVVAFVVIPLLGGSEQMLLAFPDRSGEADLYLLKLGQEQDDGVFLAEEANWGPTTFLHLEDGEYQVLGSAYGAFVPGSNHLFLWYVSDDETVIQQMRIGDREPAVVMESDENLRWGQVVGDYDFVVLLEARSGEERCYIARPGGEAQRVAKADTCRLSEDYSSIILSDISGDETTISVVDLDGENEEALLDEVEDVASYRISHDVSHLAYVQEERGDYQLHLVERRSGADEEIGDRVSSFLSYGFIPESDTLYYVVMEDEDDEEAQLYVMGEDRAVAEGVSISVSFSSDGRNMIYVVSDEDGDEVLYVRPATGGEEVEIADGEEIRYEIVKTNPERLIVLIEERDETTVLSASLDGRDVVELLNMDDVELDDISYVRDGSNLYLELTDEDGERVVFVTPVDRETGFQLLDGWASVMLLNEAPGGRQLVFAAVEDPGDDPVLYSLDVEEDADPVELDDDAEGFRNAVFTSDGRSVIYTAVTGTGLDDVEVRQVQADGGARFESLYEEAVLVDVRWADISPF